MAECRHGLSEDCPGCMQETIDALRAEVAKLKRHAQRAPKQEIIRAILDEIRIDRNIGAEHRFSDEWWLVIEQCLNTALTSTECGEGK